MRGGLVHVYWLNYEGKRISYGNIPPTASFRLETFVTHPWIVIDEASGDALGIWYPEETYSRAVIH